MTAHPRQHPITMVPLGLERLQDEVYADSEEQHSHCELHGEMYTGWEVHTLLHTADTKR